MKSLFSKRDKFLLATILLLLVLFISYAQFFYLNPLKSDLQVKEKTLNAEQKQLESLNQNQSGEKSTETINTSELQQQLPVKPLQDQFILDLEKAETVSNSQINSMRFLNTDKDHTKSNQTNAVNGATVQENGSTSQQNTINSSGNQNGQSSGSASASQAELSLPAGLNKITVELDVTSPGYEEFEKFIESLEQLKRIVAVDSIQYTGESETTTLEQNKQLFTYKLTVSAFYMPGLSDLQANLPKIEAPEPENKKNPLNQFPDIKSP